MEQYAHIIMLALGAVGLGAAVVMEITAYMQVGGDKKKKNAVLYFSSANFIYILLAYMLLNNNGRDGMMIPCLVLGIATFLSSVAQGIILRRGIENGALSEDSLFSRCIFYCAIAEIPSIAALVYFFLSSTK